MNEDVIWVATYERVSSDDQRDRETIETQRQVIDRFLAQHPTWRVYRRYRDNGVSGTIPLRLRPDGKQLVADASRGCFVKLIFTRSSRLGRDEIDLLQSYAFFQQLGIELVGVSEPVGDQTMFGFGAILNGASRRQFLAQSKEGMDRAAREGRYCGGIVPYGYKAEGKKPNRRLVPATDPVCGDMSEADVIRLMYRRIACDGWSCRRVAEELNALGVPPSYAKDGRLVTERGGTRKKRTKGIWTAQRVRNTVIQPIYKGDLRYGRRSKSQREVISARVSALVSEELWDAAQEALSKNRLMAKNSDRVYLLKSVVRCALCGRHYSGSWHPREGVRYRCNGAVAYRQMQAEKCPAASFRGTALEPFIWGDVERWLRDPGDLQEELTVESNQDAVEAVWSAERGMLASALDQRRAEKDRLLDLYQTGEIEIPELKERIADVSDKVRELDERLQELDARRRDPAPAVDQDLLVELRARLDRGLDDRQRQEIVCLLADIEMKTEHDGDGKKRLTAVVTYRFPGVEDACRGRGSWQRRA